MEFRHFEDPEGRRYRIQPGKYTSCEAACARRLVKQIDALSGRSKSRGQEALNLSASSRLMHRSRDYWVQEAPCQRHVVPVNNRCC
jgi:hypothetical protein